MPRVRHDGAFVRGSESMGGERRAHSRIGMREPEVCRRWAEQTISQQEICVPAAECAGRTGTLIAPHTARKDITRVVLGTHATIRDMRGVIAQLSML
eukprot:2458369-Prymnesium_polylepis.1